MSKCELCEGDGVVLMGEYDNHYEVKCPDCSLEDGYDSVCDHLEEK